MIYNVFYYKNGQRHESSATSLPQLLRELDKIIANNKNADDDEKVELSSVHITFHVTAAA